MAEIDARRSLLNGMVAVSDVGNPVIRKASLPWAAPYFAAREASPFGLLEPGGAQPLDIDRTVLRIDAAAAEGRCRVGSSSCGTFRVICDIADQGFPSRVN